MPTEAPMKAPHHATTPAIVRRVRAWPRRWRLGLMAALTLAALAEIARCLGGSIPPQATSMF